MNKDKNISIPDNMSPFERIRRTNAAGFEHWSSHDFASIFGYTEYRNFESVIGKARLSCFNSGHRIEDHFVDITEMVAIGSGAQRPIKTVNRDPEKWRNLWARLHLNLRKTIEELGGTMPEDLPTAESIKKIAARKRKQLK